MTTTVTSEESSVSRVDELLNQLSEVAKTEGLDVEDVAALTTELTKGIDLKDFQKSIHMLENLIEKK